MNKNNRVISNDDINIIKDYIEEVQENTKTISSVNDLNIVINEFENSYLKIEKENNSLKYQLGKRDYEIKYLKGKISTKDKVINKLKAEKEKIKGELQKFKNFWHKLMTRFHNKIAFDKDEQYKYVSDDLHKAGVFSDDDFEIATNALRKVKPKEKIQEKEQKKKDLTKYLTQNKYYDIFKLNQIRKVEIIMGANIENVDYQDMVNKANKISDLSAEANSAINDAYQRMREMSNNWYGISYDKFAKIANGYVERINQCFRACITQIPSELIAKARSYAKSNLSDIGGAKYETIKTVSEIPLTNKDTKLKFVSSAISNDRSSIEGCFNVAANKCDDVMSTVQTIDWNSVAGANTKQELKAHVRSIKTIMEQIKTSLSTLINSQQTTIDLIEGAQEIVEAGKEITEDMIEAAKSAGESLVQEISDQVSATWESLMGDTR